MRSVIRERPDDGKEWRGGAGDEIRGEEDDEDKDKGTREDDESGREGVIGPVVQGRRDGRRRARQQFWIA